MINYYLIHLLYHVKYVKQGLNNSMMAKIETEENPAEMGQNIFCWCTFKKNLTRAVEHFKDYGNGWWETVLVHVPYSPDNRKCGSITLSVNYR